MPTVRTAEAALLGGVALLPLMDPLHVVVFGAPVIPSDALFGIAIVAWVLRRPRDWRRGAFPTAAVIYLAAILLAVATSEDRSVSFGRLVIDTYVVGLGVLVYAVARSEATRRRLATAWLVGSVVAAAVIGVGLLFYAAGFDAQEKNIALFPTGNAPVFLPRFKGLFSSANMMCSYLVVAAAIVAVGWVSGRLAPRRAAVLAGAIAFSAFWTWSPGIGAMALAGGLAVWLGSKASARWRGAVLAGAAVIAVAFFVAAAATPRATVWDQAVSAFVDRPLVGHGPGVEVISVVVTFPGGGGRLTDAHQTWLNLAVQTGVVGVLTFAALVGVLVVAVHRRRPLAAHPSLLACWCAFVAAVLYHGLSMSTEQMRHVWIVFGALAAAAVDRSPAAAGVDSA